MHLYCCSSPEMDFKMNFNFEFLLLLKQFVRTKNVFEERKFQKYFTPSLRGEGILKIFGPFIFTLICDTHSTLILSVHKEEKLMKWKREATFSIRFRQGKVTTMAY